MISSYQLFKPYEIRKFLQSILGEGVAKLHVQKNP